MVSDQRVNGEVSAEGNCIKKASQFLKRLEGLC